MSQPIPVQVDPADADALETLWQAAKRAEAAFTAVKRRVEGGGKVQRMGERTWFVLHNPSTGGSNVG